MHKKMAYGLISAAVFSVFFSFSPVSASAASSGSKAVVQTVTLKQGMHGKNVELLQNNLKQLGFFKSKPTGYYGSATTYAVKMLQKKYRLKQDGKAGKNTLSLISRLLVNDRTSVSRSDSTRYAVSAVSVSAERVDESDYLMPWFGGAEDIFSKGQVAVIYDVDTGLAFKAKRTYGHNHADCEPLTSSDTAIMKKIYGGQWSWERRAVVVVVDGKRIAGSMAGMPHAGVESQPGEAYVSSRSAGYGAGTNLDDVKGNAMSGHFDIHFLGSRTHGTDKVDDKHQSMIAKAAKWLEDNY
ncbi:MAG: peptidoglycan-binding protein [Clostridia bacterium]|nr:peptidoglycan-binding protein [Clostridia bacterium]